MLDPLARKLFIEKYELPEKLRELKDLIDTEDCRDLLTGEGVSQLRLTVIIKLDSIYEQKIWTFRWLRFVELATQVITDYYEGRGTWEAVEAVQSVSRATYEIVKVLHEEQLLV